MAHGECCGLFTGTANAVWAFNAVLTVCECSLYVSGPSVTTRARLNACITLAKLQRVAQSALL